MLAEEAMGCPHVADVISGLAIPNLQDDSNWNA